MLQSYCLKTHYIPEDNTGEKLQDALSLTLEERNLNTKKQVAITTDSESKIKLACQMLNW